MPRKISVEYPIEYFLKLSPFFEVMFTAGLQDLFSHLTFPVEN